MTRPPRVLHFEDDQLLGELYRVKFQKEGFDYLLFTDPTKDPVSLVVREKPDIILMSVIMPVKDGFDATRLIKSDTRTSNIPIIFLTTLGQSQDIEKGMSLGAAAFLVKPNYTPQEVVNTVLQNTSKKPSSINSNSFSSRSRESFTLKKDPASDILAVVFFVLLAFGLISNTWNSKSTTPPNTQTINKEENNTTPLSTTHETVVSVVDGDTVKLESGESVRIVGIDTPETVHPSKPVQCFGKEASNQMKQIVEGKVVRLETDPTQGDRDKYDRLLRYVYVNDQDVGAMMISEGYAFSYRKYPVSRIDEYNQLETEARENKRGLWADDSCAGNVEPTPEIPTPEVPEPRKVIPPTPENDYDCSEAKTCSQMVSCDEAYYFLNTCGDSARDSDGDGVPCESICPGG